MPPSYPAPGSPGRVGGGHGSVGLGVQMPLGSLLQDGGQGFQQVLHHPLAVGGYPRQIHPAQHRVEVVFRPENVGEQRLDAGVVVSQQRKARLGGVGAVGGQGGGFFFQFLVQRRQGGTGGEKPVVEVGVGGVEAQHAVPIDGKFLHTGVNGQLFHGPSFLYNKRGRPQPSPHRDELKSGPADMRRRPGHLQGNVSPPG